jgi:hypothetical protein
MARYKVQLYNVPDKYQYDPLPLRAWYTVRMASWPIRIALMCVGSGVGLLISHFLMRVI